MGFVLRMPPGRLPSIVVTHSNNSGDIATINSSGYPMDRVSPSVRSAIMRAVKSRDTRPERKIRQILRSIGVKFRSHLRVGTARPDIVLVEKKIAILVHGCFWHRHRGCRRSTMPRANRTYWKRKFLSNVERDNRDIASIRAAGFRTLVIWECGTQRKYEEKLKAVLGAAIRSPRSKQFPIRRLKGRADWSPH